MRHRLGATVLAAVAFAATPAAAEQDLPGHRVAGELVGNTVKGAYRECGPRMDFFELYLENGEIRGKERPCNQAGNWSPYVGKWEVKDGQFCTVFSSDRESGCYTYTTIPGGVKRTGGPVPREDDLVILEGNPEQL